MALPAGYKLANPDSPQPSLPAGYKIVQHTPLTTPQPAETADLSLDGALKGIGNTIKGLGTMAARGPQNATEAALYALGGPGALLAKDAIAAHVATAQKAIQAAKNGDASQAAGYGAAALLPGVGPWAAHLGETAGQGKFSEAAGEGVSGVLAPKIIEAGPGMAGAVADGVSNAAGKVAPVAPILGKALLAGSKELPVVGGLVRGASKFWDVYQEMKDELNPQAPPAKVVPAPPVTFRQAEPGPAPTRMAPPAITGWKTAPAVIDDATHQKLAVAAQDGSMSALPAAQKAALTKAVATGDTTTINSILDGKRAHSAVSAVDQATQNKVAVLARYASDHGVDLNSITPDARQALADAAYAHGVKNGLTVPKNGYRGISDDTWSLVNNSLKTGS